MNSQRVALALIGAGMIGLAMLPSARHEAVAFEESTGSTTSESVGVILPDTGPSIPAECLALHDPIVVVLTEGDDVYNAGHGNHVVFGLGGDDVILGGLGDDCIVGGPGRDFLRGGTGGDFLFGNEDDDSLHGNLGRDYLDGGPHEFGDYCDAGTPGLNFPVVNCEDRPSSTDPDCEDDGEGHGLRWWEHEHCEDEAPGCEDAGESNPALRDDCDDTEPGCEDDGGTPLPWWADGHCHSSATGGILADLFNLIYGAGDEPDIEADTTEEPEPEDRGRAPDGSDPGASSEAAEVELPAEPVEEAAAGDAAEPAGDLPAAEPTVVASLPAEGSDGDTTAAGSSEGAGEPLPDPEEETSPPAPAKNAGAALPAHSTG